MTTLRERRAARWRAARPAIAWTFGAFGIGVVIALAAVASLGAAQQACMVGSGACPDWTDSRIGWLTFAFFGVPLIWLLGLLLLAVHGSAQRRR